MSQTVSWKWHQPYHRKLTQCTETMYYWNDLVTVTWHNVLLKCRELYHGNVTNSTASITRQCVDDPLYHTVDLRCLVTVTWLAIFGMLDDSDMPLMIHQLYQMSLGNLSVRESTPTLAISRRYTASRHPVDHPISVRKWTANLVMLDSDVRSWC